MYLHELLTDANTATRIRACLPSVCACTPMPNLRVHLLLLLSAVVYIADLFLVDGRSQALGRHCRPKNCLHPLVSSTRTFNLPPSRAMVLQKACTFAEVSMVSIFNVQPAFNHMRLSRGTSRWTLIIKKKAQLGKKGNSSCTFSNFMMTRLQFCKYLAASKHCWGTYFGQRFLIFVP
jgi:hypothetical protein